VGGSGDSGVMDSAAQRCGDSGIDDWLRWRSAEACARGGEEWSKARDDGVVLWLTGEEDG
jgi:hypothetical protein